jgi:GrpB-like predicted nucleotidyltransferase (UPF0157 family)
MKDDLNKLTASELGRLFPVILADYNPVWPKLYRAEKQNIIKTIGPGCISRIEHIGSTAVPGLIAKPTIDILLEILEITNCDLLIEQLQLINYQYIPRPENPSPHMMFAKGYSISGITGQTFHIHVRYPGDWDEIVFRDYLINKPRACIDYSDLKRTLAEEFRNDRDGYTDRKTAFIKKCTQLARIKKV